MIVDGAVLVKACVLEDCVLADAPEVPAGAGPSAR